MFLFGQFLCLKIPFGRHVAFLSFTHRNMGTSMCQKIRALFCVKLQSTKSDLRCNDCQ